MNNYSYLFPFESIPYGSKILIYGAGNTGLEYIMQLKMTHFCELVGIIDKRFSELTDYPVSVFPIEKIPKLAFDYIVIAQKHTIFLPAIMNDLERIGVRGEQIVYVGERDNIEWTNVKDKRIDFEYAFHKQDIISIAVKIPSGMGDCIISKKIVERLEQLARECKIDIYTSTKEYAENFYKRDDKINGIITPEIARYENKAAEYMLSVRWEIPLAIDEFKFKEISIINSDFADVIHRLKTSVEEFYNTPRVFKNSFIHRKRAVFNGTDIYSALYYGSILEISDYHVDIPIDKSIDYAKHLVGIKRYITINYGNSTGLGKTSKQWPFAYFEDFVKRFKKRYPDISVIQTGARDSDRVLGCDRYVFGENLDLVKNILLKSIFHLDIEGGVVHLATQLGTKCIVLFGPTEVDFYGYKQNINITAGRCQGCFGLSTQGYTCVRDLDEPECMYSITPELVMKYVDEYMSSIEAK